MSSLWSLVLCGLLQGNPEDVPKVNLSPRTLTLGSVSVDAEVGMLQVPEDRTKADSRKIEIAFGRLKSKAKEPRSPLVYLAGGPGEAASPLASNERWLPFLEIGDVILIDQRGVGRSKPNLTFQAPDARAELFFCEEEEACSHFLERAEQAAAHFREQGVDIACYQTRESAADVDEVRRALKLPKISLLGHSYGTHLGQEIVRRFGANVDRFVCVGTCGMNDMHQLPAELDQRLKRLSEVVARDPRIGKAVPDFFASVVKALELVKQEPIPVEVRDDQGAAVEVLVGLQGLRFVLLRDLGDVNDLPVLPRLVHTVLKRDASMLQWFVQKRFADMQAFPTMTLVCRSASGASADRWTNIEKQAPGSVFGMVRLFCAPDIDPVLGVRDLGEEFRQPVRSDVPALFLSGTLDANTPPEQAEKVRAGFKNGIHLIAENGGHEDLLSNERMLESILRFLKGEAVRDARLEFPTVKFALLEGPDPEVEHPSLSDPKR